MRRDHIDRRLYAAAGGVGRSQQNPGSGISKPYTWRRQRLAWASRSASMITARERHGLGQSGACQSSSAPATVADTNAGDSGVRMHSMRRDLERAYHERLPGARIIIARPPSIRYKEAEHAPLLQPAEFITQSSDGRIILGVLQRLEDVCFKFHVPFLSTLLRPRQYIDELRCVLTYNPASDECEFFCNSHDVALVGESSIHSYLIRQGHIQNIKPGMWTIAVPSGQVARGNGFNRLRPVVEFLLLKRTYASTLKHPVAKGSDENAKSLATNGDATAMQPSTDPLAETLAEFVMGTVQSPGSEKRLPSIPEEEALMPSSGPFYQLQDGETIQVTTSPAGSNNAQIERRYAKTAESYQVTRLQSIDRNRNSSVFACIHSKLPHTTLVAKALNVRPRIRSSIASLATHWSTEMEILRNLDHRNIVKILAWDARFYTVYLEHLPDCLASYPKEPGFTQQDAQTILLDVASALSYLEEKNISHNDIKPRNIAYSPERGAVVLDFGLATEGRWVPREAGGTAWYVPPEALRAGARSNRGNVWAFGVTMLYVLGKIGTPEEYGSPWDFLNLRDPNGADRIAMESWADEVCTAVDELDRDDPMQCVVSWMMEQEPHERLAAGEIESEFRRLSAAE
ncbi:Protein kinase-like domain [Cordyceps javanica]|uniref:Protein kinase-like domain n=1 Tax=Cordyceps javanica TaxID=43265 RepID=A0A545VFR9_9HYPO|nr:Protein kinase-like domain [Cordyceps javanica]TQW11744.1 Protein kinase-like domain [Cordyceps javanica]